MELFAGIKISGSDSDRHGGTIRDELFLHHKNPVIDGKFFECQVL
jgi:hypothetical protein